MDATEDLEKFRKEWWDEVKSKGNPNKNDRDDPHSANQQSGQTVINDPRPSTSQRINTFEPFLIADKLLEGHSGKESIHHRGSGGDGHEDHIEADDYFRQKPKRLRLESDDKEKIIEATKPKSLLDIFLCDLIEITEIPFFDLDIPREVAMKIFQFLDAVDLCRCAQVSKAWKNLAEDELLWCRICHNLGYDETSCTLEKEDWKIIVKNHVLKERNLQLNWKNRVGEVQQLEYVRGGVLSAVASHGRDVAAGFTSGEVKLWNLQLDDEITLQPSNKALVLDEGAEEGTISNYPTQVTANALYTAAAYSQGVVDIWATRTGKRSPVYSYEFQLGASGSRLCCSRDEALFALASDRTVRIDRMGDDGCIQLLQEIRFEQQVVNLRVHAPTPHHDVVLVSLAEELQLHVPAPAGSEASSVPGPEGASVSSVIHHVIGQKVGCFDCKDGQVVMALTETDYNLGVVQGGNHKLKLCCLATGREVQQFVALACQPGCVDLRNSPHNMFVTGCYDRKVRLYDVRLSEPVLCLSGLPAAVNSAQMDDVKVVSGSEDGLLAVWDQRMAARMWDLHNRHPVKHLFFQNDYLVWANIPYNKFPVGDGFDNMTHRRNRGSIYSYNFSTNQETVGVPEICQSTFDEPERYNYNVRLAMPYDAV